MTHDELKEKAFELSKVLNCTVEPIVFKRGDNEEEIIGFIKRPDRMLKCRILDMAIQGTLNAASTLFDIVLLKEHSDARFSSGKECDDDIYFGGCLSAFATIEILTNQFQKK